MLDILSNARFRGSTTPKAKPKPKSALPPQTEVAAMLRTLQERHGMIPAEIKQKLSMELGFPITHTRLYGWLRGREPRLSSDELGLPNGTKRDVREREARRVVLVALKNVARDAPKLGGAWVLPAAVRRDVERWLESFTEARLSKITGASIFTVRAWSRGSHRVRKAKWAAISERVSIAQARKSAGAKR